ncbi:MAG: PilZ domain-containing protein [Bacteriovoracaceae bacterium]|nr:PilZ domain-containing protein [Bacteriovoracaceae bacterium]
MVIIALLKNPTYERAFNLFPLDEWKRIYTIEELYHSTLDPYDIIMIDYAYVINKELAGISGFINSFLGPKIFGVQLFPNLTISFLYLNPIERISSEDFLKNKPWENQDQNVRRHHRFGCPVPCEVKNEKDEITFPHKTFLDQLSLQGALIHGHYDNGSTIVVEIPTEEGNLKLKSQIKWSSPWGKVGIIPQCGIQFKLESSEENILKKFIKEKVIPYYLTQQMGQTLS